MKDYEIKDKIIEIVIAAKTGAMTNDISKEIGVSHDKVFVLSKEIVDSGILKGVEIIGDKIIRTAMSLHAIQKTTYFYSNGGYKAERLNRIKKSFLKEYQPQLIIGLLLLVITISADRCQNQKLSQSNGQINDRIDSLIREMNETK